ncbi:FGGY-family carbohydrate kinase [Streptomyces sp. NPDC054841]
MSDFLLGVDAGHSVTKAVLFDAADRQVACAARSAETSSPRPRWVERDMHRLWRQTADAIRDCLVRADVPTGDIAAVGICGHGDGLYPVDQDLVPVRPAVTALDTRAHSIVSRWRASPLWQQSLESTGQVPFAASPSALLTWFGEQEPAVLERSRWLLFCKDWLTACLTGQATTDPTDASASFTDVRTQRYSDEVLDLFRLSGCREKLPPIAASGSIAGYVSPQATGLTGLPSGTPVCAGAHDVHACAVGMGAIADGALSLIAGTFSINQIVSTSIHADPRWQVRAHLRPGRTMNMSTSPASATNLEWFIRQIARDMDFQQATAEAATVMDGPSQVLFLPFLFGSPHGDQHSGAFVGVRGWHTRAHLLRAVFEGMTLNHRTHLDALGEGFSLPPTARLGGGGARSPVWSQMCADALRTTIEITEAAECGARGAALLAGLTVGLYPDITSTAATVRVIRTHQPDPQRAAALDALYALYQDALEPLAGLSSRLCP